MALLTRFWPVGMLSHKCACTETDSDLTGQGNQENLTAFLCFGLTTYEFCELVQWMKPHLK